MKKGGGGKGKGSDGGVGSGKENEWGKEESWRGGTLEYWWRRSRSEAVMMVVVQRARIS